MNLQERNWKKDGIRGRMKMDKSDISLVFIDNKNGITMKIDNIGNSIRIPAVGEYVRIFFKDVKYRYKVLAIETMYSTLESGVLAMCRYDITVEEATK